MVVREVSTTDIPPLDPDSLVFLEESLDERVIPNSDADMPFVPEQEKPLTAAERVRRAVLGEAGKPPNGEGKKKREKIVPPKPRDGALVKPLTKLYVSVGIMIAPFDPVCSTALFTNAEKCAESLDALARENPAVRAAILALVETSAWGGVLAAHLPLLLMVVVHHGPPAVRESVAPVAAMMNGLVTEESEQSPGGNLFEFPKKKTP